VNLRVLKQSVSIDYLNIVKACYEKRQLTSHTASDIERYPSW
jgi:hypothetical protein